MENKFIFTGAESGNVHLLLTAGGNRVDGAKAAARAEEALVRGDAALLRAVTGFAFGGVSPVGHLTSVPAYADWWLLDFE